MSIPTCSLYCICVTIISLSCCAKENRQLVNYYFGVLCSAVVLPTHHALHAYDHKMVIFRYQPTLLSAEMGAHVKYASFGLLSKSPWGYRHACPNVSCDYVIYAPIEITLQQNLKSGSCC